MNWHAAKTFTPPDPRNPNPNVCDALLQPETINIGRLCVTYINRASVSVESNSFPPICQNDMNYIFILINSTVVLDPDKRARAHTQRETRWGGAIQGGSSTSQVCVWYRRPQNHNTVACSNMTWRAVPCTSIRRKSFLEAFRVPALKCSTSQPYPEAQVPYSKTCWPKMEGQQCRKT